MRLLELYSLQFSPEPDNEFNIYEELIGLVPMTDTTTNQDIIQEISQFCMFRVLIWVSFHGYLLKVQQQIWLAVKNSVASKLQNTHTHLDSSFQYDNVWFYLCMWTVIFLPEINKNF